MPTVLGERALPVARPARWSPLLAVLAALALLYAPTYWHLAHGLWRDDEYAHGPIVLAVFAWLAWRSRDALAPGRAGAPAPIAGAVLLAAGLALYAVGRSQSIALFEVASHLPVLAGLVLLAGGRAALARFAFPLAFLLFLVPLPGFILAELTAPLKALVSGSVATLLHAAGYPVERSGVVLTVGAHPLLVADACSGLNSITALFAMALLYAHLTGGVLRARAALLLAAVVPIAVAANVLRVAALALAVYHFGDDAAQGFLHGIAGLVVFVASLGLLLAFDRALGRSMRRRRAPREVEMRPAQGARARAALAAAALAIAGIALATPALTPVPVSRPVDLEGLLPAHFAGWRIDPTFAPVAPTPDVQAKLDLLYGQVVSRTYVNSAGERMMLTVAYGGDQSDALKAHRQEACYAAQGFRILALEQGRVDAARRSIPVTRFVAVHGARSEPVTYWFTMGDRVVLGRLERLRVQLAAGFAGRVPDGMLVRVSSLSHDAPAAYAAQRTFVAALLGSMPESAAARLAGRRGS